MGSPELKRMQFQLINFLIATGIDVWLLLDFGEQKVEQKEKFTELPDGRNYSQIMDKQGYIIKHAHPVILSKS